MGKQLDIGSLDAHPDTMHRTVKMLLDTGMSLDMAYAEFMGYRLCISVDKVSMDSAAGQTCLLTMVELARRVFLGGIYITGSTAVPTRTTLACAETLEATLRELGVHFEDTAPADMPLICLNNTNFSGANQFAIRPVFRGWRAGVVPCHRHFELRGGNPTPLAAIAAAALAVNEAFLFACNLRKDAGRRIVGLSLWQPDKVQEWAEPESDGPVIRHLPSELWILGLGHLGQAYLWTLASLPYADRKQCTWWLQDTDTVTTSTFSTSVLCQPDMTGMLKTRVVSEWLHTKGFDTRLVERLLHAGDHRHASEPHVLLCGVDNNAARRALQNAGFGLVYEAGLGSGAADFKRLRLHTVDGLDNSLSLWPDHRTPHPDHLQMPSYKELASHGLDQCGMALLAGKAVGAPFVGMFAASMLVADLLRSLHGGSKFQVHDIEMNNIMARHCVASTTDGSVFPKFVTAAV